MKFSALVLLFAAAAVVAPLSAAPKSTAGAAAAASADMADDPAAAPKSGVRFVICAPDGAKLPSVLYYKSGKTTYKSVTIGSRTPTPRIRPEAGVINFYAEDPTPAVAAASAATGAEKKEVKMPEPALSIPVPGSGKQLCILVPSKSGKTQSFIVKESAFPKGGMHIINFSSFPLKMTTATKPDFSDKKESIVGVFHSDKGISDENTWTFKGDSGQSISFMLAYKTKDAKTFKNFKASKFIVSDQQSQINIVVKDPSRDTLKLLSIQMTEDK